MGSKPPRSKVGCLLCPPCCFHQNKSSGVWYGGGGGMFPYNPVKLIPVAAPADDRINRWSKLQTVKPHMSSCAADRAGTISVHNMADFSKGGGGGGMFPYNPVKLKVGRTNISFQTSQKFCVCVCEWITTSFIVSCCGISESGISGFCWYTYYAYICNDVTVIIP